MVWLGKLPCTGGEQTTTICETPCAGSHLSMDPTIVARSSGAAPAVRTRAMRGPDRRHEDYSASTVWLIHGSGPGVGSPRTNASSADGNAA